MKKRIGFSILLIIVGIFLYNYIYQDHRDVKAETPEFVVNSNDLISQFSNNSEEAEKKFLNKTIQVSGLVTEISNEKTIVIDNSIFCQFKNPIPPNTAVLNKSIVIKGRCIGFDDLLEEIKLDQCSIINN
ncbi:hypothetical protein [Algibacter sp. 2305UL17-15]|uniref:OB-fold protein n=1 Tax=Algibacter sp. 2305UL17-15 TaxID=3231268 RepID=UPI00345A399B